MNKLFTSSGYVEADALNTATGKKVDFQALPAFLRVLLTTDGTVTKSLESFFWEPVVVENLGQDYVALENAAPIIDLQAGARVLHRKVQLKGSKSQRVYTTAVSLIRAELLDVRMREDLEAGNVGIGELLRECGLETYREIVEFGYGGENENKVEINFPATSIWRRYRIIMNHQPFIQITEEFPLAVFGPD